jgi:hypothetical protein
MCSMDMRSIDEWDPLHIRQSIHQLTNVVNDIFSYFYGFFCNLGLVFCILLYASKHYSVFSIDSSQK